MGGLSVCRQFGVLALALVSSAAASPDAVERGLAAYRAGDVDTALRVLTDAAEGGDAEARFSLGAIYLEDAGVPPDPAVSTRWYRAAAEQGHVEAQFSLGNAYLHGRGVASDPIAANRWWRRAGRAGSADACLNLAVYLLREARGKAAFELGLAWLQRADRLGAARAQEYLSLLGRRTEFGAGDRDGQREPLRSEARLLTLDPGRFTLQLASVPSRAQAEAFVQRQAIEAQALLFRLPKDRQVRWNVVYGVYESGRSATETIALMRADLSRSRPWPRPVGEIQALIESVWIERDRIPAELLR